jgi:hypothetical protein
LFQLKISIGTVIRKRMKLPGNQNKIPKLYIDYGWKHGILNIFFILSRLDESRHKIAITPMTKLVYIEFFNNIYT